MGSIRDHFNIFNEDEDSKSLLIMTPSITSEAAAIDPENALSIPWPGSTFIMRNVSTGKAITFRRGKVMLGPIDGNNAIRWECVEKNGWLGFREPGSYKFLGHNVNGDIICAPDKQLNWESFCIRQRPDGKYLMLLCSDGKTKRSSWKGFCPVGYKPDNEPEQLTVVEDWKSKTIAWEFIKVEGSAL